MTDPTQLPLEALENIEAQSGIQLTELEFDRLKRNLACIDSLTEPDRSPEGQGHQLTQQCKEIAQLILDFETSDLT